MDPKRFVREVLRAYLQLGDTPSRARPADRALAARLHREGIPLESIHAALVLGAARRRFRPPPPLPPIRSLHYFLPVLEEIRRAGIDPDYVAYLEYRLTEAQRCDQLETN